MSSIDPIQLIELPLHIFYISILRFQFNPSSALSTRLHKLSYFIKIYRRGKKSDDPIAALYAKKRVKCSYPEKGLSRRM